MYAPIKELDSIVSNERNGLSHSVRNGSPCVGIR